MKSTDIMRQIDFRERQCLDTPPTQPRRGTLRKSVILVLALALLTTCFAIVEQGDEICKQLGIDPWGSGLAAIAVWMWACVWFVYHENGRSV